MGINEKIRVLFLITDLGKGGAERYLIDLCSELEKDPGFEFIIGSLFANNQYEDITRSFNVKFLNYQTFSLRKKNQCLIYKELLDSFKPHIIHTHRFLAEFLSSFYVINDVKYLCHGHDNMVQFRKFSFNDLFSKLRWLQLIERNFIFWKKYQKVQTFFIANSNETQSFFRKVLPKSQKSNALQIPLGFKYERFHNPETRTINLNKPLRIINVGSFQEKKNQILIVKIASELRRRNIHFEINLIGQGENFGKVQKAISDAGLKENIFLRGVRDDVERWYKESDIYLHTAWYEPFGLVLLEAMASGLPVITLDGKGNRDIMKHGKNGFIFSDQDPVLYANAIQNLIRNPSLYHTISNYAKDFAKSYDSSVQNRKMIDFYRTIVEGTFKSEEYSLSNLDSSSEH